MMAHKKRSMPDMSALHKEWDEALCPICLDYPHNAVLLLCSSNGKGCRPYICDTSYRHSNCLDRYRKMKMDFNTSTPINQQNPNNTPERSRALGGDDVVEVLASHHPRESSSTDPGPNDDYDMQLESLETADLVSSMDRSEKMNLKCPLCRGDVQGWKVVEEARKFFNLKTRSCSRDSCRFVGSYHELRRHARRVHPSARPAEIDPSRQRAWRSLEHQREYDDVVSAIHAAMPGATVWGDFVIENGDDDMNTADRGRTSGELNEPFWTTLFRMLAEPRSRSRGTWSRQRPLNGASPRQRYLWGENLLGMRDESDYEVNVMNVNGDEPSVHRRRRNEISVINIDDDHDDLPAQRRPRFTRTRSSGNEL